MQDIYFLQERWSKAWSVKDSCARNVAIKEHLLFLHSWSGCDLTSAVFGKGKPKVDVIDKASGLFAASSSNNLNIASKSVDKTKQRESIKICSNCKQEIGPGMRHNFSLRQPSESILGHV